MTPSAPLTKVFAVFTFLLLLAGPLPAREEHPLMHEASTALRAAQGAADPAGHLEQARRHLRAAKENKRGYRADAIKRTEEALAALKAGDRIKADKAIREALHLIEKGVALNPGDDLPRKRK